MASERKPWLDVPMHDDCGPIVFEEGYRCAACGDSVYVTAEEAARVDRAQRAWDRECERQDSDAKQAREDERKRALLREAVARRRKELGNGE
jgi:hypothetical protein